jgi:hypothetical protein
MANEHHKWLSLSRRLEAKAMATYDYALSTMWLEFRAALEDYQQICDKIHRFLHDLEMNGIIKDCTRAPEMTKFIESQTNSLVQARRLDCLVRDTLEINIGGVALRESRRSIHQPDNVGRISLLAFIFLLLSLVMSFFGMYIREISGSGASWKTFLGVAVGFCVGIVIICFILWRKSPSVRFVIACMRIYYRMFIRLIVSDIFSRLHITPRSRTNTRSQQFVQNRV